MNEVEYELNSTDLYECICDLDWDSTLHIIATNPVEAKIWVIKRESQEVEEGETPGRFLPLHSACSRNPPRSVISALIDVYPEGCNTRDDDGMYPIHYATANQASYNVINLLLQTCPEANFFRIESQGSLPIHLAAQWGVSSLDVLDILLENCYSLSCAKDNEGKTPLEVALASDYDGKELLVERLRDALEEVLDESTCSSITTLSRWKTQDHIMQQYNVVSSRVLQAVDEPWDDLASINEDEENAVSQIRNFAPSPNMKSLTRMRAEIMAIRARRALIRSESEERVRYV